MEMDKRKAQRRLGLKNQLTKALKSMLEQMICFASHRSLYKALIIMLTKKLYDFPIGIH